MWDSNIRQSPYHFVVNMSPPVMVNLLLGPHCKAISTHFCWVADVADFEAIFNTNLSFWNSTSFGAPLIPMLSSLFLNPKRRIQCGFGFYQKPILSRICQSWKPTLHPKKRSSMSPVLIQFCSGSRPWYIQKNTSQMMANGCSLWRCITLQHSKPGMSSLLLGWEWGFHSWESSMNEVSS